MAGRVPLWDSHIRNLESPDRLLDLCSIGEIQGGQGCLTPPRRTGCQADANAQYSDFVVFKV